MHKAQISSDQSSHEYCCRNGLSLKSIFIGSLVALGLGFLLALFIAIFNARVFVVDGAGIANVSILGFIAILLCGIIAKFVGGWVAAYLGHSHSLLKGVLYGFSAWVVALFILIMIFSPMTTFFNTQLSGLYSSPPAGVESKVAIKEKKPVMLAHTSSTNIDTTPYTPYGLPLFMLFVCLCTGAIFSCLGGYSGTKYRQKEEC